MDNSILYTLYKEHPVVTTDSRDCPEGSIFLALKGESFDGNKFAAKALEQGCSYAVVDDPAVVPEGDARYVLVADTLVAFKELARAIGASSPSQSSVSRVPMVRPPRRSWCLLCWLRSIA